jgi:DNA-binding response OmpR family regulator
MAASLGRVLVVDDELDVREMLEDALTYFGYEVRAAITAEDALGVFPTFRPDVVLLDLALPGMSGEQMLDRLRTTHPGLPVIMITGNTDGDVAQRLLAKGAFDYLAKPFDIAYLAQVLRVASVGQAEP